MATESPMAPVNGSYVAPPQYSAAELPAHAPVNNIGTNGANGQNASSNNAAAEYGADSPSKDEVGWYFVEQYYTNMSKSPEKLHVSLSLIGQDSNLTSYSFSTPKSLSLSLGLRTRRSRFQLASA